MLSLSLLGGKWGTAKKNEEKISSLFWLAEIEPRAATNLKKDKNTPIWWDTINPNYLIPFLNRFDKFNSSAHILVSQIRITPE